MKKNIFIIFIFLLYLSNAQTLKIQVLDSTIRKPEYLWLKIYNEGALTIKDSILVSNQNKNNLYLNIGKYIGYAELSYGKKDSFALAFIFNYQEKEFLVKFSSDEFKKGELTFLNSIENLKDAQLQETKKQYDAAFIELKTKYLKRNRFDSIIKNNTFLYSKIIADFIKTPTTNSNKNLNKYFDNYDAMLHWHYFDMLDFSNPLILNHPFFNKKIDEYFSQYCDKATYIHGVDDLMHKSKVNYIVKNYTFNYLIDYFLKRKQDQIITYLYENYSEGCGLKLDADKIKELTSIVQTQIGSNIPDIVSYDNKGEIHSLYNEAEKNKYTLVYVWTSWCHACQKHTPKIAEITETYKKKGLGVFSISLDEKKEDWLLAIQKYKLSNWINVAELVELQKSTIITKLNTRSTPKVFLIDRNSKIIAKDCLDNELKIKLTELLK